jgi:hypothetical protein
MLRNALLWLQVYLDTLVPEVPGSTSQLSSLMLLREKDAVPDLGP